MFARLCVPLSSIVASKIVMGHLLLLEKSKPRRSCSYLFDIKFKNDIDTILTKYMNFILRMTWKSSSGIVIMLVLPL